jgi:hypothetical protein
MTSAMTAAWTRTRQISPKLLSCRRCPLATLIGLFSMGMMIRLPLRRSRPVPDKCSRDRHESRKIQ